jgi:hypothetical protein
MLRGRLSKGNLGGRPAMAEFRTMGADFLKYCGHIKAR